MHGNGWRTVPAAMAILLAAGAPAAARGRDCAVEARLEWVDVLGLAPFAYSAMARETREILADHGICAAVRRVAAKSVRSNDGIGVVLLRSMPASVPGQRILGATRRGRAQAMTVWVYFDQVASAVGLGGRPPATWSGRERAALGRALGRVAAHEVVHVLLPQRPHDSAGLMAASLGFRELTGAPPPAHRGLLADVRRARPPQ